MNSLYFECALGEPVCASAQTWNGCAHPVELWKVCGEPGMSARSEYFFDEWTGELFFNFARRPLFHEIAHHLQEGLSLGAQRAVTGMNEVEASV
jgi:hypothetical protein